LVMKSGNAINAQLYIKECVKSLKFNLYIF
jgi:hypothetical protein